SPGLCILHIHIEFISLLLTILDIDVDSSVFHAGTDTKRGHLKVVTLRILEVCTKEIEDVYSKNRVQRRIQSVWLEVHWDSVPSPALFLHCFVKNCLAC